MQRIFLYIPSNPFNPWVIDPTLARYLSTYIYIPHRNVTSPTMRISSLSSAFIVALAGVMGANPPKGICGFKKGHWSKTFYITLTEVHGDAAPVCPSLWRELKKCK